jgi:hypothetical protein
MGAVVGRKDQCNSSAIAPLAAVCYSYHLPLSRELEMTAMRNSTSPDHNLRLPLQSLTPPRPPPLTVAPMHPLVSRVRSRRIPSLTRGKRGPAAVAASDAWGRYVGFWASGTDPAAVSLSRSYLYLSLGSMSCMRTSNIAKRRPDTVLSIP